MKKVIIIGDETVTSDMVRLINERGLDMVRRNRTDNTIVVNGVAYEPREQSEKKAGRPGSKMGVLMGVLSSTSLITNPYAPRDPIPKPLPVSDIVAEFELIQRKESKLSRSQRDRVVWAFNKMYKPI